MSCRGIALDTFLSHQFDHKGLIEVLDLRACISHSSWKMGLFAVQKNAFFYPKSWNTVFYDISWTISCTEKPIKWFYDQLNRSSVLFLETSRQPVTLPLTTIRHLAVSSTYKVKKALYTGDWVYNYKKLDVTTNTTSNFWNSSKKWIL